MARVAIFMLLRTFKIPGCGHMGRCNFIEKRDHSIFRFCNVA